MSPDPLDGLDTASVGVPRPISPATADDTREIGDTITSATADIDAAIGDAITSLRADVDTEMSAINLILGTVVGGVDITLTEAESLVSRVMETTYTRLMTQIASGETEATYAGVIYPWDTDTMRVDLADDSGDAIISRLMGQEPTYAPTIPVDPGTLPVAVVGGTMPVSVPATGGNVPLPPAPPSEPLDSEPIPVPLDLPDPVPVEPPAAPMTTGEPPDDGECGCRAPAITLTCPAPVVTVMTPPAPGVMSPPAVPPNAPPAPLDLPPPAVPPTSPPVPSEPVFSPLGGGSMVADPIPTPPPMEPAPSDPVGVRTVRFAGVPFDTFRFCRTLRTFNEQVRGARGFLPWEQAWLAETGGDFTRALSAFGTSLPTAILTGDERLTKASYDRAYEQAADMIGGASLAADVVGRLPGVILADKAEAWWLMGRIAAGHKAATDSGYPTDHLVQSYEYAFRALSPQTIPGQGELDYLVSHGFMEYSDWECSTRMHGNIPALRVDLLHQHKPHPSAIEVELLRNRGELSEEQYAELMKRAGQTDAWSRSWWSALAKFVPGPADLTRFMVRDAFDPLAVQQGQLDKDFELKFYGAGGRLNPGPAARWAQAQGMTEDQFRYFWYSHWEYPSNTALYEMLHRLRPDRPEVVEWVRQKELRDRGILKDPQPPRPAVVTRDDVRRVVEINDMAPAWVDALLDVSYHPVTRTDAIDAYQASIWTEDQLYHAMRDNGYSEVDARRLVDIQSAKKKRRVSNISGTWTVRKIVGYYKDGSIDSIKARQLLTPLLTDPQAVTDVIVAADDEVRADSMRKWISYERRAYFHGAKDGVQVVRDLVLLGVTPSRADDLVLQWRADRDGRFREPSTRNVVTWLKLGIIRENDARERLARMGYLPADIDHLIAEGYVLWRERIEGKLDKGQARIDKWFKDQRAMKKATEKEIKDAMKEAEKRQEKLRKEMEKMRKEMEDRAGEQPE